MKKYWIKFCAFFALSAAVCAFAVFISNMWDTPAVPAVAQTTEIEFYQQREEAMEGFSQVIARYEEEHPGVKIRQQNIPNALELLVARMQRGDVPDIFTNWPTQLSFIRAAERGLLLDLSEQPFLEAIDPATLEMSRAPDGKVYALPINRNCMEVYYNADIFRTYGLKEPQTIDEMFLLCDRLQQSGIVPMVFCVRDSRIGHVAQIVLSVLVDDYLTQLGRLGNGTISPRAREQMEAAFDVMLRLGGYGGDSPNAYTYYEACERFASGKAAMYISGSYALNAIENFDPEIEIDVFPLPGYTADRRVMLTSVDTALCISAQTPLKEETLQFLSYMTQPEIATLYAAHDVAPSCIVGALQENPITLKMQEHIETFEHTEWIKSRYSLESAMAFEDAVCAYMITGDLKTLMDTLTRAFAGA